MRERERERERERTLNVLLIRPWAHFSGSLHMSESTNVNFTCIKSVSMDKILRRMTHAVKDTCMHTTSISIHIHTVMSCETELFFQLTFTSHMFDCSSLYLLS